MLLKELIQESLSAKEKKQIVIGAAELLGVDQSKVLHITDMWDAVEWNPQVLDEKEIGQEKLILRGERGDNKVRVVHLLKTASHPNKLYATLDTLKIFLNSEYFSDTIQHHLKDGDKKWALSVLNKFKKYGLTPQFIIDRLKKLAAEYPEIKSFQNELIKLNATWKERIMRKVSQTLDASHKRPFSGA